MYILLKKLCEDKGCTGYRMSKDCGASANLMTELKSGRKKTVSAELAAKLAEYFSVPVEYILGLTPEAQMIELEAELSEVSSQLDSDPDNFELQSRYDVLKEQIEDLKISMGLIGAKKDPSTMSDEGVDKELHEIFTALKDRPEMRALLNAAKGASASNVQAVADMLLKLKGGD